MDKAGSVAELRGYPLYLLVVVAGTGQTAESWAKQQVKDTREADALVSGVVLKIANLIGYPCAPARLIGDKPHLSPQWHMLVQRVHSTCAVKTLKH